MSLTSKLVVSLIDNVSGPARQVGASLNRTKQEAARAAQSLRQQGDAARGLRSGLEGARRPIDQLTQAERRLRRETEAATRSLRTQSGAARRAAGYGMAGGAGGAGSPGRGLAAMAVGRSLMGGAGALGVVGGAAGVAMASRYASHQAMSMARSMYDVERATDASGIELKRYEQTILDLSRATGKTKEELAGVLAAAGFAGRPAKELTRFMTYAAMATTAWGTNAEETAQAMAELGSIYSADQKRIEEIGDAVNTAADISASKEADLLAFLRRAGASANAANISAEHTLAFGAALKEVGVRTDVAATGFEALLNMMKLGAKFSKQAGNGLKQLGVNSDKMRKSFIENPVEAILDLLNRIKDVTSPMKRAEILTNLFGKEYQDDIQKLLNGLPRLTELLRKVGDKANNLGSVAKGFELMKDKDFNKLDRAARSIEALSVRIGRAFTRIGGAMAEPLNNVIDKLEKNTPPWRRWMNEGEGFDSARRKVGAAPAPDDPERVIKALDPNRKPFNYAEALEKYDRQRGVARAAAANVADEREVLAEVGRLSEDLARLERYATPKHGQGGPMARKRAELAAPQIAEVRKKLAAARAAAARVKLERVRSAERIEELRRLTVPPAFTLDPSAPGSGIKSVTGQVQPGLLGFDLKAALSSGAGRSSLGGIPMPPRRPDGLGAGVPLPPVRPKVDTSEIEAAQRKAEEAKMAFGTLSEPVGVHVDASSISSAIGLARVLNAELDRADGKMRGIGQGAGQLRAGGEVRRTMRGLQADTGN